MTLFLVNIFYEHGEATAGVFSTLDLAKEATEKACAATVPAVYGECLSGSIVELELDRLYSGEDKVGQHEYGSGQDRPSLEEIIALAREQFRRRMMN